MTDDAIFRKALCDVKFRQIEGNGRKFSPIELSNSVISYTVFSNSGEGKNKWVYLYAVIIGTVTLLLTTV